GILPGVYALDDKFDSVKIKDAMASIDKLEAVMKKHAEDKEPPSRRKYYRSTGRHVPGNYYRDWDHVELATEPIPPEPDAIVGHLELIRKSIKGKNSLGEIPADSRWQVRTELLQLRQALNEFNDIYSAYLSTEEHELVKATTDDLLAMTEYAPRWVLLGIALSLGLGTMVGWKRIVVTVGEKIGKTHLTYAQGACAELVAMSTIGAADFMGLPVSTTHVLSSGVAGTMAASKSGLQGSTVRNILLAWILTLPVSMLLSSVLFFGMATIVGAKPSPSASAAAASVRMIGENDAAAGPTL
ncbi:MAG: inorganic phosphate transporter, partial [Gemmataceae bacterium]